MSGVANVIKRCARGMSLKFVVDVVDRLEYYKFFFTLYSV